MRMYPSAVTMVMLFIFFVLACNAQDLPGNWESRRFDTEYQRIRVDRIVDGLEHPWSLAFLPEWGKLITERVGRLYFVEGGEKTPISGLPEISARGQGGLLEVSLHPQYGVALL